MKNFNSPRNKSVNNRKAILFLCLLSAFAFSSLGIAQVTTVNTLTELLPYLDDDNVNVKLTPGTYTITAADIENGTFGTPRFAFTGNNNTFDFTGVTINFAADVYTRGHSMSHLQTFGNYNVIKNLTMVDLCDVDGTSVEGGTNIVMDGRDNRIEGCHITSKGSYPYGYGDCFGKGGTNVTIKHYKHCSFLIRGLRNHALNDTLIHRAYGHALYMQAASYPIVEGCYIEGEMRSTDDMLAEEGTGSAADKIDFMTTWGYRLPAGYMKSTGEGGIRAYNGGNTVVDGVDYERGTDNPTIINNTIVNMRTGVTLTHATGTKYVEGCTSIGCERGYATGAGDIVDCYADAQYGPAFGVDYESDKNITAEITILPYEGELYNGSFHLAYIYGSGHNITFHSAVEDPDQNLTIDIGGDKRIEGQLAEIENYNANNFTINNYTNYPIVLDDNSSNIDGLSGGMITDFGTNNTIEHTGVSAGKFEAEDYNTESGVTKETCTDEGLGENITFVEPNDFVEYEIDVPFSGTYLFDYRVASESVDGNFTVTNGEEKLEDITFTATEGAQTWTTVSSATPIVLEKGTQYIKITANSSGLKLNWFDLILQCADATIVPYYETFNAIGTSFGVEEGSDMDIFPGNSISFQPEPIIGGIWSWTGPDGFTADTRIIEITDIDDAKAGEYVATITNDCGQQSSITYSITTTGSLLAQAESYSDNSGITSEVSSDEGAGYNVTSIDAGDWMEYTIDVPTSATYTIDYRVASETNTINFSINVDGTDMDQESFEATGGSQVWETSSSNKTLYLTEGEHTLKITANSAGWNMNWLELQGQDFVSPCNLPFKYDGFSISNELVDWTSGQIDISCQDELDIHFIISSTGDMTSSDYLNIFYKIDGGDLIYIAQKTADLDEMMVSASAVSGTIIELIVQSQTGSINTSYNITQIVMTEVSDPLAKIEAEDYDESSGTSTESTSDSGGGENQGSITDGDWLLYSNINLSDINAVNLRLSSESTGSTIEIRLDSPEGTLIGTTEVPTTGAWQSWKTVSTDLTQMIGFYDVYFVFLNPDTYVCNINWLQFYEILDPYERFEAEINDEQSGTAVTTTSDVDGNEEVSNLQEDDYIMFSDINIENAISIEARVASAVGGVIEVRVGSATKGDIIAFIDVPNTGDTTTWQTVSTSVDFVEGDNDIYFVFKGDGDDLLRLNWLKFSDGSDSFPKLEAEDYTTAIDDIRTPSATDDEADNGTGEVIKLIKPGYWLHFSDVDLSNAKSIRTRFATNKEDASVEVRIDALDGELIGIIDLYNTESWANWKTSKANISDVTGIHDVYFVYQTESSTYACYSNWFQFSEFEVAENIDLLSKIEAEDYNRASGTAIAATSDMDGEEELTIVQNEDWILFKNINLTDITNVDIRYATSNECKIYMRYGSYDGSYLGLITLPSTDANWQTLNANLLSTVPDGLHDVYLVFKGSPDDLFKLNWVQFHPETSAISNDVIESDIELYPNPVSNELVIENATGATVELYNMLGCVISTSSIRSTKQSMDLSALTEGYYLVKATKTDGAVETFKVIKE